MAVAIARREVSAEELRVVARRLLAIALVVEGSSRTEAARITGMDLSLSQIQSVEAEPELALRPTQLPVRVQAAYSNHCPDVLPQLPRME